MDELEEMRRANQKAIDEAASTKTLSGGAKPAVDLKAKAAAAAAEKRKAWEAERKRRLAKR